MLFRQRTQSVGHKLRQIVLVLADRMSGQIEAQRGLLLIKTLRFRPGLDLGRIRRLGLDEIAVIQQPEQVVLSG